MRRQGAKAMKSRCGQEQQTVGAEQRRQRPALPQRCRPALASSSTIVSHHPFSALSLLPLFLSNLASSPGSFALFSVQKTFRTALLLLLLSLLRRVFLDTGQWLLLGDCRIACVFL